MQFLYSVTGKWFQMIAKFNIARRYVTKYYKNFGTVQYIVGHQIMTSQCSSTIKFKFVNFSQKKTERSVLFMNLLSSFNVI